MSELQTTAPERGVEMFISDVHGEYPSFARLFGHANGLFMQQYNVSNLHMVGDVYDRGPSPDLIIDELMQHENVDIQWGNHDVVWMGAALGQDGCIAHVVRNCARYGNLDILTKSYGMDLSTLEAFALEAYADDPCVAFGLKGDPDLSESERELNIKIQKAMAIIQFKVEARLIDENPSFELEDRKLLHRIDAKRGTVVVDGTEYELTDTVFPTVDFTDPYTLTAGEKTVVESLRATFTSCEKLQKHMGFLLDMGSLYKISGNNLMFHACVPLNADGSLKQVEVFDRTYAGKALFDAMQEWVYKAFRSEDADEAKRGRDILWYLWLGEGSPLFAKSKMATFELYLIADKAARKEEKNAFYKLFEDEALYRGIFADFGVDPDNGHIICGHVPVKVVDGEDPVKCGGKVVIIDGGFSLPYRSATGIAGFVLVADEKGLLLHTIETTRAMSGFAGIRVTQRRI